MSVDCDGCAIFDFGKQPDKWMIFSPSYALWFALFRDFSHETGGKRWKNIDTVSDTIVALVVMRQSTQPKIRNVKQFELLAKMESHDRS